MTTPEDLAKAEQIVRKHCGANIRATGPTVTDDDWEPGYAGLRDTIAAALAEARTTPKPAAEVVEALEELLSECESSYNKDSECVTDDHETLFGKVTMGSIHKARAALAALKAKGTDNEG